MAITPTSRLPLLWLIVGLVSLLHRAAGFSFAIQQGTLSKCGRANIVWQGGTPPFHLTVVPAFDYPQNITIPSSAWSADTQFGNFSWTVNYSAGVRLVAMMSDATAEGSGGVSPLFTVADSPATCTMRSSDTDFLFYLNSTNINQCTPLSITWDASARSPVRILGVIPSGQPFLFAAAPGTTSWRWNTNVAQGTSFIFAAFDAGRSGIGGSSDLLTVGPGPKGCLDESSPSSTPAGQVPTSTAGSGSGSVPGQAGGSGSQGGVKTVTAIATVGVEGRSSISTGAIVGIVISSVLALLALQAAILWFCCRTQISNLLTDRRQGRTHRLNSGPVDLGSNPGDPPSPMTNIARTSIGSVGTGGRDRTIFTESFDAASSISPFRGPSTPTHPSPTLRHEFSTDQLSLARSTQALSHFSSARHLRGESLDSRTTGTWLPGQGEGDTSPATTSYSFQPTTGPRRQPSKSELAAMLASPRGEASSLPYANGLPLETPRGGYHRHEDAGPAPPGPGGAADTEELPPLYKPEWEVESRHRNSGER